MSHFANKKILIISPHPDDEVLGCGGLILRAKQQNAKVYVLYLTVGNVKQYGGESKIDTRLDEIEKVSKFLGLDGYHVAFPDDDHHLKLDIIPQKEIIDMIEYKSEISLNSLHIDILAIPSVYSANQDHVAAANAAFAATRIHSRGIKPFQNFVISYETPEYTWSPYGRFVPSMYLDISDLIEKKGKAMSIYTSQLRDELHPRNIENLIRFAHVRGREVSLQAAECYEINRMVLQ